MTRIAIPIADDPRPADDRKSLLTKSRQHAPTP
jgi:hypothetical protein